MNALTARPGTTSARFPDRIDEPSADAGLAALLVWKALEGRLTDCTRVENGDTFIRPRSDEDVAHFELIWTDTGRDVYRFTAW